MIIRWSFSPSAALLFLAWCLPQGRPPVAPTSHRALPTTRILRDLSREFTGQDTSARCVSSNAGHEVGRQVDVTGHEVRVRLLGRVRRLLRSRRQHRPGLLRHERLFPVLRARVRLEPRRHLGGLRHGPGGVRPAGPGRRVHGRPARSQAGHVPGNRDLRSGFPRHEPGEHPADALRHRRRGHRAGFQHRVLHSRQRGGGDVVSCPPEPRFRHLPDGTGAVRTAGAGGGLHDRVVGLARGVRGVGGDYRCHGLSPGPGHRKCLRTWRRPDGNGARHAGTRRRRQGPAARGLADAQGDAAHAVVLASRSGHGAAADGHRGYLGPPRDPPDGQGLAAGIGGLAARNLRRHRRPRAPGLRLDGGLSSTSAG